ncbi:hypothetical protein MTR_3g087070 [Medicago truncatula]|uniref:Uncharacterized protein n=2 Tax=Medicago truncatula TaxID=3880 RepID=G7J3Q5_MEDTR|nr:hypothetical protein MTR_3g087070 [Medicago truncatula]
MPISGQLVDKKNKADGGGGLKCRVETHARRRIGKEGQRSSSVLSLSQFLFLYTQPLIHEEQRSNVVVFYRISPFGFSYGAKINLATRCSHMCSDVIVIWTSVYCCSYCMMGFMSIVEDCLKVVNTPSTKSSGKRREKGI